MKETFRLFVFLAYVHTHYNYGAYIHKPKQQIICQEENPCKLNDERQDVAANSTFTWYFFDEPVSYCTASGKCQTYPAHRKWIGSSCTLKDNLVINALNFWADVRITRSDIWYLKQNVGNATLLLNSWETKIYRKIESATCYVKVLKVMEQLRLICDVPMAFPTPLCNFTNRKEGNIIHDVEYNYSPLSNHPYYVMSNCSIILNASKKDPLYYNFTVIIYPNISSSTQDEKYGVSLNVSFTIEPPNIKYQCEQSVTEDEPLNCICTKADNSKLPTQVYWYMNDQIIAEGNNSAVINFRAQKNMTMFVCMGSNELGWTSNNLTYTPNVLAKINLETFECPDKQQHVCGQHGECFYNYEFCTQDMKVESCFPQNITNLLQWCRDKGQFNVSLMRDKQCGYACLAKFGKEQLQGTSDQNNESENKLLYVLFVIPFVIILLLIAFFWIVKWKKVKTKKNNEKYQALTLIKTESVKLKIGAELSKRCYVQVGTNTDLEIGSVNRNNDSKIQYVQVGTNTELEIEHHIPDSKNRNKETNIDYVDVGINTDEEIKPEIQEQNLCAEYITITRDSESEEETYEMDNNNEDIAHDSLNKQSDERRNIDNNDEEYISEIHGAGGCFNKQPDEMHNIDNKDLECTSNTNCTANKMESSNYAKNSNHDDIPSNPEIPPNAVCTIPTVKIKSRNSLLIPDVFMENFRETSAVSSSARDYPIFY